MNSFTDKTTPLFKGIDVKWADDAVYDISITHEAQRCLAYLSVYLETRFGEAIWHWFTPDYKNNKMRDFL